MKIAILGAMDEEIALLKDQLTQLQEQQLHHLHCYLGELSGHQVIVLKCGIGKVASAVATTLVIEKFAPDAVINTGSAGGFDARLEVGDLVIGDSLLHHDADLTHFDYQPGQCAGMPARYHSDHRLLNAAERAAAEIEQIRCIRGLICSGDAFIGSDAAAERIKQQFSDAAATEMEGAAIAQACHLLNTPFLVIRSLSDIAGKTSSVSFKSYLQQAAKHSAQLVMAMLVELNKPAPQ